MSTDDKNLLFETYKLHAELAERAASIREGLNKLYTGMVATAIAASVFLYRFIPNSEVFWVLPALGILLSLSWIFSLFSVTGRLSAKHKVLVSLEQGLPFNFLEREKEEFASWYFIRRQYTALIMPGAFLILSIWWLVILFCKQPVQ